MTRLSHGAALVALAVAVMAPAVAADLLPPNTRYVDHEVVVLIPDTEELEGWDFYYYVRHRHGRNERPIRDRILEVEPGKPFQVRRAGIGTSKVLVALRGELPTDERELWRLFQEGEAVHVGLLPLHRSRPREDPAAAERLRGRGRRGRHDPLHRTPAGPALRRRGQRDVGRSRRSAVVGSLRHGLPRPRRRRRDARPPLVVDPARRLPDPDTDGGPP